MCVVVVQATRELTGRSACTGPRLATSVEAGDGGNGVDRKDAARRKRPLPHPAWQPPAGLCIRLSSDPVTAQLYYMCNR